MRRKNSIWVLFMAGLMAGAMACGDDEPSNGNGTGNGGNDAGNGAIDTGNGGDPDTGNGGDPDAGPTDTGNGDPDTGPTDTGGGDPDTGPVDTGVDAGPPPPAAEGQACEASTDADSAMLAQDNCAEGLSCAPWDAFLLNSFGDGAPPEITLGSIQSCVQTCEVDDDCVDPNDPNDVTTVCSRSEIIGAELGNVGICVEELAGVDEACGESRISTRLIRNDDGQLINRLKDDPSIMVGCEAGLSCQHAIISSHPDEGFCQEICSTEADCTHPDASATCHTGLFNNGDGYCGGRVARGGGYCGEVDIGEKVIQTAYGCGFENDDLECFNVFDQQETTRGTLGFCLEQCSVAEPTCESTTDGNGLGAATCRTDANNANVGFCFSQCRVRETEADPLANLIGDPESCPVEQFCRALGVDLGRVDENGDPIIEALTLCQGRLEPRVAATTFDDAGNPLTVGGDCATNTFDPFRCPDGHSCAENAGSGPTAICVPRCDQRQSNVDSACDAVIPGTVCGQTTTSTIVGICGTPQP